jgi:hypothetical protein
VHHSQQPVSTAYASFPNWTTLCSIAVHHTVQGIGHHGAVQGQAGLTILQPLGRLVLTQCSQQLHSKPHLRTRDKEA